jgi:hypothetical protein
MAERKLDILIKTRDKALIFYMLGGSTHLNKTPIRAGGNAKLIYKGSLCHKSRELPEIAKFVLVFDESVDVPEASNWLYEKIKGRTEELNFGGKRIAVNKEEISEIIEKELSEW